MLYDEALYKTGDYSDLESDNYKYSMLLKILVAVFVSILLIILAIVYKQSRRTNKYKSLATTQKTLKRIKVGPRKRASKIFEEIERQKVENNMSEVDALKKTTEMLNENLNNAEAAITNLNEKVSDMKSKVEIYECKICYSKTISVILLPCKHAFCQVCAEHCEGERDRKCAMCNQKFRTTIKLVGIDESDTGALIDDPQNDE